MSGIYKEYVANLHVHTTFSDGAEPIDQVISAADRAGLDILLINDHDTLTGLDKGYEGYHGRVLVLIGLEISGPKNHYLVYGVKKTPEYKWHKPQEFIDRVNSAGGFGFLAHPFEQGSPMSENGHAYNWKDWSVAGFTGMEIWNYTSAWKTRARNWPTALFHFIMRSRTLFGPEKEALEKWDELGRSGRVAGVGGSDVHAHKVRLFGLLPFSVFSYQDAFRAVNTHLLLPEPLTGELGSDRKAVLDALAEGSCFVAHDKLGPGKGFDFRLENNGARRAGQGEAAVFEAGDILTWRLPSSAPARLLKNGLEILTSQNGNEKYEVTAPGVYRLEVFRPLRFFGPRPWIFSNPVYVRDAAS